MESRHSQAPHRSPATWSAVRPSALRQPSGVVSMISNSIPGWAPAMRWASTPASNRVEKLPWTWFSKACDSSTPKFRAGPEVFVDFVSALMPTRCAEGCLSRPGGALAHFALALSCSTIPRSLVATSRSRSESTSESSW